MQPPFPSCHCEESGINRRWPQTPCKDFQASPTLQLDGFGIDDAAIEELNGLQSLEELTLLRTTARRAQLHDLERLQSLYIDCFGNWVGTDVRNFIHPPLSEVALMKPEEVPQDGFWHPEIRLANLPKLKHLLLSGVTLSKQGAEEIERLPSLETLLMTECRGDGSTSLVLENSDKLRSVAIGGDVFSEIRLGKLLHLTVLEISHDEKLTRLSLAHLPQIRSIQLDNVPSLAQLEICDGINLDRLALSPLHGFDKQTNWPKRMPGWRRPLGFGCPGWHGLQSSILSRCPIGRSIRPRSMTSDD